MTTFAYVAAVLALLGTGVVYGTDVFCAIALRPALRRVNDAALTSVMGNVHRYADARMRVPGVIGLLFSALAAVVAALSGHTAAAALAGLAFVLLVAWMVVYVRISAPINRTFTVAAAADETLANAHALQAGWDRVIVLRAFLQGIALLALGACLIAL
ncbi:DUF1772 domain-containing protein [Microbacterium sp. P05]|uniref:DUF1772 domain-containing protein n=1 Tax=Microbacterium sp. P05 TaxID=3366948 RepID=UPI00374753E2